MKSAFRVLVVLLAAFSTSSAHADLCEETVSNDLARRYLGTFYDPFPHVSKTLSSKSSAAYRELEQSIGSQKMHVTKANAHDTDIRMNQQVFNLTKDTLKRLFRMDGVKWNLIFKEDFAYDHSILFSIGDNVLVEALYSGKHMVAYQVHDQNVIDTVQFANGCHVAKVTRETTSPDQLGGRRDYANSTTCKNVKKTEAYFNVGVLAKKLDAPLMAYHQALRDAARWAVLHTGGSMRDSAAAECEADGGRLTKARCVCDGGQVPTPKYWCSSAYENHRLGLLKANITDTSDLTTLANADRNIFIPRDEEELNEFTSMCSSYFKKPSKTSAQSSDWDSLLNSGGAQSVF